MTVNTNYVEVYVWRGKDREGYTTTSTEGIRHQLENEKEHTSQLERCGHVSMSIFKNKEITHISLWPSGLAKNLSVDIEREKRTNPDVIVHLSHLNFEKMLNAFNTVKPKVLNKQIIWTIDASDHEDVTDPKNKSASCASFVWTFLKEGGLDLTDTKSPYFRHVSLKGPKDSEFYNLTKCNLGQRCWGWFDGWWWTREYFTPYALVLRVASAAEAFKEDKDQTTLIMKSDRVAKEKIGVPSSIVTTTSMGLIAAGIGYVFKEKGIAGIMSLMLFSNFRLPYRGSESYFDFLIILGLGSMATAGCLFSQIKP